MTFRTRLKKISKPRFNLDKLKDPAIKEEFQARIGGRLAALIILDVRNIELDPIVNTLNTAVIETADELLGKHQRPKKPRVTDEILDLCDGHRELKKRKGDPERQTIKLRKKLRKQRKPGSNTGI